jgi:CRP-like cAMP-binding protein
LYLIDRDIFIDVARRNPPMALKLVAAVSTEVKKVIDLAESLSLKTAKVRLAKFLYERAMAEGVRRGREIHLTRDRLREEDVASTVGIVRVHVSRSLQSLARAGAIILDRGVIHIPDLMALERLVEGSHRLSDRHLLGNQGARKSALNTALGRENSSAQRLRFAV